MRNATFLFLSLFLLVGCDPAISVYQIKLVPPAVPPNTKQPELSVSVKSYRRLVGESWYAPEVIVKNSSSSQAVVTGIELKTTRKTYAGTASSKEIYPLLVPPGSVSVLHIEFELDHGLMNTFSKPAELFVHYRIGNQDETVKTRLVSGPEKNWIF